MPTPGGAEEKKNRRGGVDPLNLHVDRPSPYLLRTVNLILVPGGTDVRVVFREHREQDVRT